MLMGSMMILTIRMTGMKKRTRMIGMIGMIIMIRIIKEISDKG